MATEAVIKNGFVTSLAAYYDTDTDKIDEEATTEVGSAVDYTIQDVLYRIRIGNTKGYEHHLQYFKNNVGDSCFANISHGQTWEINEQVGNKTPAPKIEYQDDLTDGNWEKLHTMLNNANWFDTHNFLGVSDQGYYLYEADETPANKGWFIIKGSDTTGGKLAKYIVGITDVTASPWAGSITEVTSDGLK